jgi:hypothetical protein
MGDKVATGLMDEFTQGFVIWLWLRVAVMSTERATKAIMGPFLWQAVNSY